MERVHILIPLLHEPGPFDVNLGEQDGVPGSWIEPGLALDIVAIWRIESADGRWINPSLTSPPLSLSSLID